MLSKEEIINIDKELKQYPRKSAAGLEAMRILQNSRRWISDEAISDISEYLDISASELESLATFYNLIFRKSVGRHVILLCNTISCWIKGYETIEGCLYDKLGIRMGETTSDNRFTLLSIACLGACDKAPVMMVDEDLHVHLTKEKIDDILEQYQ
jgi:NADH-quinone oxidoreductase subunit E